MMKTLHFVLAVNALLALGAYADGDVNVDQTRATIIYSDESAFVAAVSGTTGYESFESLPATNSFSSDVIVTEDFTIMTQPQSNLGIYNHELTGLHATDGTAFAGWAARPDDNDATFTFNEPILAFGLMITDPLDGDIASAQLLASTDSGDSATVASGALDSGTETFFGLISDQPFTQVTFAVTPVPSLGDGVGFDEVRYSCADSDEDGISNCADNCTLVSNVDQLDTDDDGIGNICDADLNNDCIVNVLDLGLLKASFFSAGPHADFNGDGVVNVVDLGIMRANFFSAPGPSGIFNSCI